MAGISDWNLRPIQLQFDGIKWLVEWCAISSKSGHCIQLQPPEKWGLQSIRLLSIDNGQWKSAQFFFFCCCVLRVCVRSNWRYTHTPEGTGTMQTKNRGVVHSKKSSYTPPKNPNFFFEDSPRIQCLNPFLFIKSSYTFKKNSGKSKDFFLRILNSYTLFGSEQPLPFI